MPPFQACPACEKARSYAKNKRGGTQISIGRWLAAAVPSGRQSIRRSPRTTDRSVPGESIAGYRNQIGCVSVSGPGAASTLDTMAWPPGKHRTGAALTCAPELVPSAVTAPSAIEKLQSTARISFAAASPGFPAQVAVGEIHEPRPVVLEQVVPACAEVITDAAFVQWSFGLRHAAG
jgi:hypothetical protein